MDVHASIGERLSVQAIGEFGVLHGKAAACNKPSFRWLYAMDGHFMLSARS